MTLLELCEPLFLKVCELNRMARLGQSQEHLEVREEMKRLLKDVQLKAASDCKLASQAKELELPLVFFVDSMVASSKLRFANDWHDNRLARDCYYQLAGDERFFDLLEETLNDTSDDASDRLAVFYVCLGLGFVGMFVRQPGAVEGYVGRILPRIRHLMDLDTKARLCPDAYNSVDTRDLIAAHRSHLRQLVKFLVVWPWLLSKRGHELLDAYNQQVVEEPDLVQSPSKMRKVAVACVLLGWTAFLAYYGTSKIPVLPLRFFWPSQSLPAFAVNTFSFALLLLIGICALWVFLRRRRVSKDLVCSLDNEAAFSMREFRDRNKLADLDNLRRHFMEGIQEYRSRGKDIYSLPWFLVIGECASGKTEAIRNSNLVFPPGLNDFMQGAGGTLNMDWWFTNHGVLLDVAGNIVFGDWGESPGRSFLEMLKLLRSHRPNCPINGLVLTLSVDSLISDSAGTIGQKAGHIARQLELIQRRLDVRFPVSLLVTKCDKLTGFREFFEHIDDPELQCQMVGWSNPDPLDVSFCPDSVDHYLDQVIHRLRKRRLGLLRQPTPTQGPQGRRADEVDALYALPKSLSLIVPRLRRYLETIFVAGESYVRPVFMRGIYFTSAVQVGTDLDEAVWSALGHSVTEAGTGGASQLDLGRSFFLRDVFFEKVFRERGLVVRLTRPGLL